MGKPRLVHGLAGLVIKHIVHSLHSCYTVADMPTQKDTIIHNKTNLIITAFVIVVLAGLVLLISKQTFGFGGIVFDIFTYVLSVVALILAVLSVLLNMRQGRMINRMVRDVHAAVSELKEVSTSNDKIEREINEEYHMNKVITDVLSEYGIGDDKKIRRAIARKVSHRMKKS